MGLLLLMQTSVLHVVDRGQREAWGFGIVRPGCRGRREIFKYASSMEVQRGSASWKDRCYWRCAGIVWETGVDRLNT